MFSAIYRNASACVRVTNSAGEKLYSGAFPIDRGVVQGDIFSPVVFILALAVVMARYRNRVDAIGSSGATEEAEEMPQLQLNGGS